MKLCRVIGTVVASVKHPVYRGHKLMVVQPVDPTAAASPARDGRALATAIAERTGSADVGKSFLAVDQVQAGPGDLVLVMSEGSGVRQILQTDTGIPIRSLIVAIVDRVELDADAADDTTDTGRAGPSPTDDEPAPVSRTS